MSSNNGIKRRKISKKIFLAVFCLVAIILSVLIVDKYNKILEEDIEVVLVGGENQKLAVNSKYKDDGFKVLINDTEIDKSDFEYDVTNNINEKELGVYKVTYNITYKKNEYKLVRNVQVVDVTPPVLTVEKESVEIAYCNKDNEIKMDYKALDDYDGDLTSSVEQHRKDDYILLYVADSSGNDVVKKIPIKIMTKPTPKIELKGSATQYIKINTEYKEDGAILTDGCGKTINDKITITDNIDENNVGTYKVTYSYKTDSGKNITTERKVVIYKELSDIKKNEQGNKVVYLTFDDGPGQYTAKLLDILKKYNVKATFFVTNQFKKYVPLIEREAREGHVVAVHTLTHKWSIYKSVDSYMNDFNSMNDIIYKYTGSYSKIFRFPGGSSNTISKGYSKGVVSAISSKLLSEGYVYFDWNVDSNDAAGATKNQIYKNVINGMKNKKNAVVLMHDIKKGTVAVIEDIIVYGLKNGYTFKVLTENSPTVRHTIRN